MGFSIRGEIVSVKWTFTFLNFMSYSRFNSRCPLPFLHAGRVGSLDTRRRHIGVASVHGSLYAVGGSDGASYLKSAERFDPKMNQVRC